MCTYSWENYKIAISLKGKKKLAEEAAGHRVQTCYCKNHCETQLSPVLVHTCACMSVFAHVYVCTCVRACLGGGMCLTPKSLTAGEIRWRMEYVLMWYRERTWVWERPGLCREMLAETSLHSPRWHLKPLFTRGHTLKSQCEHPHQNRPRVWLERTSSKLTVEQDRMWKKWAGTASRATVQAASRPAEGDTEDQGWWAASSEAGTVRWSHPPPRGAACG